MCEGPICWEDCANNMHCFNVVGFSESTKDWRKLMSFVIGLATSVRTGWAGWAGGRLGCLGQGGSTTDEEN